MAARGVAVERSSFLGELRHHAALTPDATALIEPASAPLTFAALQHRIDAVAHSVRSAGVGRNQVVALAATDGANLLIDFLGITSAAACAVLNPALRPAELDSVLADLAPHAMAACSGSEAEEIARRRGIPIVDRSSMLKSAVAPARPEDIALLLHTSATTGKARIVPLTHSNVQAMAANTGRVLALSAADRFLNMMPLFHLQGLLSSVAQLLAGGSVISTAGFDAHQFLSWLEEYRPTWYTAGPALHHNIVALIESRPEILETARLRFVRSIGAPLSRSLMEQLERTLRAPVLEGYGMTEAGAITSNAPPPGLRRPGSAGRTTGSEVAIMSETGELSSAGCQGEIVVRGPAVMRSYFNNPDADRESFRDGWFRTGDLGRLDADGFLFVTGRIKDIINRGGEKILPAEIEEALSAHPAVAEAIAFGVVHPTLGEDVAAAVVMRAGKSVRESELRDFANQRLAAFKVPRRIFVLDSIPKGATGKSSRAAIAEQFKAAVSANFDAPAALTATQRRVADAWRRVLKIESAGLQDNFFELGGDSLALTLMTAELDLLFEPQERAEFLAAPTIETLAEILDRGRNPSARLVVLQPENERIPFFCIPAAHGAPENFRHLAAVVGAGQPFFVLRDPRPPHQRGIYTIEEHAQFHLEVIRAARPHGPYLLGGHCYGGIVAFEIARLLLAAGERVALLVLFQVPTPGYPKVVRNWRKYLAHAGAFIRATSWPEKWKEMRAHLSVWKKLIGKKRQAITRRALVSAGMHSIIEPIEPLELRNERAGRAYKPSRLDCDMVHFLAADEVHSTRVLEDARLGWRDFAGAGFSVARIPGAGDDILKPPNVSQLGREFRSFILRVSRVSDPAQ
jgi:oxalate---CoA ligase